MTEPLLPAPPPDLSDDPIDGPGTERVPRDTAEQDTGEQWAEIDTGGEG